MGEVQGPPKPFKVIAKPEPALGTPPIGERFRRRFEDKGITRRQLVVGGAGLLGLTAAAIDRKSPSSKNKIPTFFSRRIRRTSSAPPVADTNNVNSVIHEDTKPPKNEAIKLSEIEGQRLPLKELLAAVEAQNDGNVYPVTERLEEYNSSHHGHETVTLDATDRTYHKTDAPVFGIYKIEPPAIIRTSPRSDEENIAFRVSDEAIAADAFPEGYFLGYDILGSKYDGSPLGNQRFDIGENQEQGIYDFGGIWIGIANVTKGEDGTYTYSPDDRLLPKNTDNHGVIPSVAALRATAIPTEQAQSILSSRQSS